MANKIQNQSTGYSLMAVLGILGILGFLASCGGGVSTSSKPDSPPVQTLTLSSISPAVGSVDGGSVVILNGNNFADDARVSFGNTNATSVTVTGPTRLTATTPSHDPGQVDVTVSRPNGSHATLSSAYVFDGSSASLSLQSATPSSGPAAGGTVVTILGGGFRHGSTVTFGGVNASATFVNPSTLSATAPPHAAGSADIAVTNPDGTSVTLPNGFQYQGQGGLAISSVSPNTGPAAGGTVVTILGGGFQNGATVKFGGVSAGVSFVNVSTLSATAPPHAAGSADITVTNPDGASVTLPNGFRYPGPPEIWIVSPNTGPTEGGTTLTITGNNFLPGAAVLFGSIAATSASVVNTTQIQAVTPPEAAGAVSVKVTNPDGLSATVNGAFTFGSSGSSTGHWSHINILDFGRGLTSDADYKWFAEHVDVSESGYDTHYNPNMLGFTYDLDATVCEHRDCSDRLPLDTSLDSLPEKYFLHVSNVTVLRFLRFGTPLPQVTINPCVGPIDRSCRLETYIWEDRRWVFNAQDPDFRAWMAARLNSNSAAYAGVFLDEHGAGFTRTLDFADGGTQLISGGAVHEYGGLSIGQDSLETQYNTDLSGALAFYHSYLATRGKFLFVNTAAYSTDTLGMQQAFGAKGVHTEMLQQPDAFDGPDPYEKFVRMIRDMAAAGGVADLFGATCYWGHASYTNPGNYTTAQSRYLMWRLASYYLLKEPVGSSGRVYFDPSLCINAQHPPQAEWQKGYEFDVGQPSGPYSRQEVGGATIFQREYTKATILVRPQDCYNCENYGDSTAVTVNLGTPMRVLNGEGQLSAPTSSVQVRNAEALVLIKP